MVMWRNIFAIMAVTLRMSSAVRLYIVHSVKDKRGRGFLHYITFSFIMDFHNLAVGGYSMARWEKGQH